MTVMGAAAALSIASPALAASNAVAVDAPVVIVGIGGLSWDNISPTTTPHLWELLEDGAATAGVTVSTLSSPVCPTGGWLAISAGRPTFSPHDGPLCRPLPNVIESGDSADVGGWAPLAVAEGGTSYESTIGTLGTALAASGVCATAVGPGAALALADQSGHVDRYLPALDDSAYGCPLTVIDAGSTSDLDASITDLSAVDTVVGQVLDSAPAAASVVVTSVSLPEGGRLALGAALVTGTAIDEATYLTSPATRRPGVVRLLDLPSTVMKALGLPEPADFQGSALDLGPGRPGAQDTVQSLVDISIADRWLRMGTTTLINTLGAASIVLGGLVLLLARRRLRAGRGTALVGALLVVGAAPIAAYLVTLTRWWRFEDPALAMWAGIAVLAAVLGIAAGLTRGAVWRPVLALSLVTSSVLVIDGLVGTPLHWASPFGTSPSLGNRYYGFGNATYSVWAVHTLVLAGILGTRYVSAGRRRAAAVVVLLVGVVSVIIDVWPTWGADVGGGLALVPAFVVMAMMISGVRVTPARAVIATVGGVVLVGAVAVADWLRPVAQRSHAGQFVQSVIDGDAGDLFGRKISYATASFSRGPAAWITLAVLVLAVLAFAVPPMMPTAIDVGIARWPQLRAIIVAILISSVLGTLVNDWGIRVATVEFIVAAPLIFAVCLRARTYAEPVRIRASRSEASAERSPSPTTPAKTSSATMAADAPPATAPTKETSAKR